MDLPPFKDIAAYLVGRAGYTWDPKKGLPSKYTIAVAQALSSRRDELDQVGRRLAQLLSRKGFGPRFARRLSRRGISALDVELTVIKVLAAALNGEEPVVLVDLERGEVEVPRAHETLVTRRFDDEEQAHAAFVRGESLIPIHKLARQTFRPVVYGWVSPWGQVYTQEGLAVRGLPRGVTFPKINVDAMVTRRA